MNACNMIYYLVHSGEKASKAASERVNNGRTLAAVDPMIRKNNGVKVDMFFLPYDLNLDLSKLVGSVTNSVPSQLLNLGLNAPTT